MKILNANGQTRTVLRRCTQGLTRYRRPQGGQHMQARALVRLARTRRQRTSPMTAVAQRALLSLRPGATDRLAVELQSIEQLVG
jgi:hypothetical protein